MSATNQRTIERIGDLELQYVREVLATQFRSRMGGRMTNRLEKGFAQRFGCEYAISFVNGTATMHAALAAAGVGPGDEVVVPPLTMASTSLAVLHAGATPVFADIEPATWTIDPQSIAACVSDRTRAIIPVAIYGLSPQMDEIMALADRHDLFVLEDDAECFLGTCGDRLVGTIGHASSFSFQSSKHMTAGEGGMVITDNEELADRIRAFNSLGYANLRGKAGQGKIAKEMIQDPCYARHDSIGWNYRMPEVCAAVALAQLERLEELVERRCEVAALFGRVVQGYDWIVPQAVPYGFRHTYWTYVVRLEDEAIPWRHFRDAFVASGGDSPYGAWRLTYWEPAFQKEWGGALSPGKQEYRRGLCPNAEVIQPRLVQFKTNYWNWNEAERQAGALADTVRKLNG